MRKNAEKIDANFHRTGTLSGVPVNKLGVVKSIANYKQQHLNIFSVGASSSET